VLHVTWTPVCTVARTLHVPVHGRQLQLTGPVPQGLAIQSEITAPLARVMQICPGWQVWPVQMMLAQAADSTRQVPEVQTALVRPAPAQFS
jgi:hypothetical protein